MKHTPGPWTAAGGMIGDGRPIEAYSETGCQHNVARAELPPFGPNREAQREVNAALIAAAPDLLAAAERALPWLGKMIADGAHLNSVLPNDCIGAMHNLSAAIQKAGGKE